MDRAVVGRVAALQKLAQVGVSDGGASGEAQLISLDTHSQVLHSCV